MSSSLVCGLGNPGSFYARTRHNLGFMVLDGLCAGFGVRMRPGGGDYLMAQAESQGRSVYLIKPLTYVNESGIAVSDALSTFGVSTGDLLVVCDDCELPFGSIRLRSRGSSGGHRGLESIVYHLGSEVFPRLRIGIDKPAQADLAEYVLDEFEASEVATLPFLLDEALAAVRLFLEYGAEKAMSLVNRRVEVE